ncbi:MAG: stalk domain-containing protein [Peptococcaceae bacterium]|nr:stalk domain-containing protein [Peptococcaceae bacterium]
MNKISKKIVALITMAMFVLTLVPAAAFAAEPAKWDTSYFTAVADGKEVKEADVDVWTTGDITDAHKVTTKIVELDGSEQPAIPDSLKDVKVWAVDANNNISSALKLNSNQAAVDNDTNVYTLTAASATTDLYFTRAGEYTVYAGQTAPTSTNAAVNVLGSVKVTVEGNTTINNVDLQEGTNPVKNVKRNGTAVFTSSVSRANGVAEATIALTAKNSDNDVLRNKTFAVSSTSSNVVLSDSEVTTDRTGKADFTYKLKKTGTYTITLKSDDITVKVQVSKDAEDADAQTINTTVNDKAVLAAGVLPYGDKTTNKGSLKNAVQFEIKDTKGNVMSKDLTGVEPAATLAGVDGEAHDAYLSVDSKPKKSNLKAEDLTLFYDPVAQVYTLQLKDGSENKLVEGEYAVTVSLLSGENATANFTVAEPGDPVGLELEVTQNDSDVDDQVVAGSDAVDVVAKYVDENGVTFAADTTDLQLGVDGKAATVTKNADGELIFTVAAGDSTDSEKYIGSTITVKVYDGNLKKYVEKELTVVQSEDVAYTLAFNKEAGEVNNSNDVKVSVVDENGDVQTSVTSATAYAYVADQSDADANVTVSTGETVTNGVATLTLSSDKETTADIVVAVKHGNNIYAKTLKYTFGEEAVEADKSVVMTIGSSDMVVNNEVVKGDAAPYVKNSRTYVPIRSLTEAFGAKVDWNGTDRTVTVTLGNKVVVMTVDKTDYTVDGADKTMDVAPEIVSDRTYVPVRFVGEALGFNVTALYDQATGTTASVVFQK